VQSLLGRFRSSRHWAAWIFRSIVDEIIRQSGFDGLPVLPKHGIAAGRLPRLHNDPFDRMLIAQALSETLTLVSQDQEIGRYEVALLVRAV
jgi:PIN domain nuclease of toxin-antitoxin system